MSRDEWLRTLSKDDLIIMVHNLEYRLELTEDKVEYLTGCRGFGENDGMNGSCVECSYDWPLEWEKCRNFNDIFWRWHCKKFEMRCEKEKKKDYKDPEPF